MIAQNIIRGRRGGWPGLSAHVPVEPDVPEDPDRESDLPDVNPGSNPDNPGDRPQVREPGRPPDVVAHGLWSRRGSIDRDGTGA